jgi:hypothetical protein
MQLGRIALPTNTVLLLHLATISPTTTMPKPRYALDPNEPQKMVLIRFTENEWLRLQNLAAKKSLSMSEYIRELVRHAYGDLKTQEQRDLETLFGVQIGEKQR